MAARTLTLAPIAERFDTVPISFILIQLLSLPSHRAKTTMTTKFVFFMVLAIRLLLAVWKFRFVHSRSTGCHQLRSVSGGGSISFTPCAGKKSPSVTEKLLFAVMAIGTDPYSYKEFDCGGAWWENSHMTTIVRADEKGRICIRGTRKGQEYLVKAEKDGWWVIPVAVIHPPKQRREWAGSTMSLAEHLRALADSGLRIEPADQAKQKVGRCRF